DPIPLIQKTCERMMPEYFGPEGKYKLAITIVDNAGKVAVDCVNYLHETKPDWVSIWNIDFDFPTLTENMERHGYDPRVVMSDPSVPNPYKYLYYKEGRRTKEADSGREMSKAPFEQ